MLLHSRRETPAEQLAIITNTSITVDLGSRGKNRTEERTGLCPPAAGFLLHRVFTGHNHFKLINVSAPQRLFVTSTLREESSVLKNYFCAQPSQMLTRS